MDNREKSPVLEHAYNLKERQHKRRALVGNVAKAALAGSLAVGSFLGVSEAMKDAQANSFKPDSYYSGAIEIVMSENLNLRETPLIINTKSEENANDGPNIVDWTKVEEVNGVNIKNGKSIVIDNPLITKGESPEGPTEKGLWVTFDAKVNNGITVEDEKLYVSLSPSTSEYVKSIEPGSFIDLSVNSSNQDLGKTKVNN